MDRSKKIAFVESFSESVSKHACMIVVHHSGIDSQSMNDLRRASRSESVSFHVVKNSLLKLAIRDENGDLSGQIKGPVGVFLSQDPVAASKIVSGFAKKKKGMFAPLVGTVSGKVITANDIQVFATLPNFDQMRSILLSTILAPVTSLARVNFLRLEEEQDVSSDDVPPTAPSEVPGADDAEEKNKKNI